MKKAFILLLMSMLSLGVFSRSDGETTPSKTWASSSTWTVSSSIFDGGEDIENTDNDMTLATDDSSSDADHYILVKEGIKLEADVQNWFTIVANHSYSEALYWDHFSINERGIYTLTFHIRFVEDEEPTLWVETEKTSDYTPEIWSVSCSRAFLGDSNNDMTLLEEESSTDAKHYVLVKEGAKLEPPINYYYIYADHSNIILYPSGGQLKFNVDNYGIYTVTFHLRFTSGTTDPTIWVETVRTGDYYPGEKTWTILGTNESLLGTFMDVTNTSNDMELNHRGLYQLIKRNVALNAGYNYYWVVANHSWDDENYGQDGVSDGQGAILDIPEDGIYDVLFTFDESWGKKELKHNFVLSSEVPDMEGVFTSTTEEGVEMRFRKISETEVEVYGYFDPLTKDFVPAIDEWYYNESLSITIPEEIDGFTVSRIGDYAFYNVHYIEEINIPNTVTSIGKGALTAYRLTSCTIPASVTDISSNAISAKVSSIVVAEGNPVYDSREGCNAVIETSSNKLIAGCKNTIIPDGVVCIGDHAFFVCNDLKNLTMPESVQTIGNNAFDNCI